MIEQIFDFKPLNEYDRTDLYSVKIKALAKAYGFSYSFAKFYCAKDENGVVTAIFSALDSDYTLSYDEHISDIDELKEFFSFVGFSTLHCDASFNIDCDFSQGDVMKCTEKREVDIPYAEVNDYPHLFDLYNFVDYGEIPFNDWYVDISHRIRKGTAFAATIDVDDEIISSAVLTSIFNSNAVLSAVRTKPQFRNLGYGSALVRAMCCSVSGTVYIMRENGKNEHFYEKLGFENSGKWRIYKCQNSLK